MTFPSKYEVYIDKETAKLLKKLGFDWDDSYNLVYWEDKNGNSFVDSKYIWEYFHKDEDEWEWYPMVSAWRVQKWLRVEKKIVLTLDVDDLCDERVIYGFGYSVRAFAEEKFWEDGSTYGADLFHEYEIEKDYESVLLYGIKKTLQILVEQKEQEENRKK